MIDKDLLERVKLLTSSNTRNLFLITGTLTTHPL